MDVQYLVTGRERRPVFLDLVRGTEPTYSVYAGREAKVVVQWPLRDNTTGLTFCVARTLRSGLILVSRSCHTPNPIRNPRSN